MRNDYIGASIDGDHAAGCSGCHNHSNTIAAGGCGCARQGRSGCNCQASRQGRPNNCNECESNAWQDRSSGCGECRRDGRTPGMVYAEHHDLDNTYCAQRALVRGTLFGCLDKPMCGDNCAENPCTTRCQEEQFALWELRLYLNTHPCDKKALALLRQLTRNTDEDCDCTCEADCGRWSWTDGPWPWEYQHCCGKEA